MVELSVKISSVEKTYPIKILEDEVSALKTCLFEIVGDNNFLAVISEKVFKLYGKLIDLPKKNLFILKDGEKEKNFKTYQKILTRALKMKLTRNDYIIAIGGGVCGDIAGFVAATYMRGIRLIQIPTTLLACVDSSVGGKTAIDTDFGKNLVGAFYQPEVVLINTNFLKTLDERQFKTGMGEVVKYAFIEKSCRCEEDFNLINFISQNAEKIIARDRAVLNELIRICVRLKISVVEKDEKESGLRRILNFGHTYAHAIEKVTNYKKYTHGEAVVKGIEFIFDYAEKSGLVDADYKFVAMDMIGKFDFHKVLAFDGRKIVSAMKLDKKADGETVKFILPSGYAEVKEYSLTPEEVVLRK